MRKLFAAIAAAFAVAAVAAASAFAGTYAEAGDAGNLPATAQNTSGSGDLTAITGVTGGTDADMYKLCLTGGGTFSATTVGSALFDTQLFLFTKDGIGVEANDDGGDGLKAILPAGGLSPTTAGVYYLAISAFEFDPVSPAGLIFPTFPYPPVYGPTGPGGGQAVSGWAGFDYWGTGAQAYTIGLTGARFCAQQGAAIDIKPGSDKNPINLGSKGVIPVVILTTPDFDAATVDVATVTFEGASEAHGTGHLEDVDLDGDLDMVLHFRTQDTSIAAGDTEACLTGTTSYGETISDCDSITIVP